MENTEKYIENARLVSEAMSGLNTTRFGWNGAALAHYNPEEVAEGLEKAYEMLEAKKQAVAELEAAIAQYEIHKHLHEAWRDNEIAEYKAMEERMKAAREAKKLQEA